MSLPVTLALATVTTVGSWYWASLVQYVFHRLFGHVPRIHRLYKVHLAGHHGLYPPNSLRRARFDRPEGRIAKYFLIPLLPVFAAFCILLPQWIVALHAAVVGLAFWAHYWLHSQYHLSHSRFDGQAWFEWRRGLHFQHHAQGRTNYALVDFFWDRVFGTRRESSTTSSNDAPGAGASDRPDASSRQAA